jgi:hypothetical protein
LSAYVPRTGADPECTAAGQAIAQRPALVACRLHNGTPEGRMAFVGWYGIRWHLGDSRVPNHPAFGSPGERLHGHFERRDHADDNLVTKGVAT